MRAECILRVVQPNGREYSLFLLCRFPLFSRGVDRARFEYGVYLLNKNLEQLLQSQGFVAMNLKLTLPNLATFMNHQLRPASSVQQQLPHTTSLSVLPSAFLPHGPLPQSASPPLSGSLTRIGSSSTPPMAVSNMGRQRRDSPSRRSAPQSFLPTYSPPRTKIVRSVTGVSPSSSSGAASPSVNGNTAPP